MNKAYEYAKWCLENEEAPKYVKLQCKEFIRIYEGKDEEFCINETKVKQIEGLLKLLIMPKGLKAGQTLYECTTNYQWLFYTAILCVVRRDNINKRKYETALLEISRKNFKTFTIATIFIILLMLEPKFSQFYSVAPDGSLSKEVSDAMKNTIKSSPLIYEFKSNKRFKLLRDYILFKPYDSKFTPLAYTNSTFDGKLPNVFLADEVGALPNNYAIEGMRSGQINILNKLGCIISTKYPTFDNPFEEEVKYAKEVLDGVIEDKSIFALLYEPDDDIKSEWTNNDLVLKQANPVALEIPEIWEDLKAKRQKAIIQENLRENFLTKHCNIIYQGQGTESFIDIAEVQKCKVDHINWSGREVYLGVDLSQTNDNTAVVWTSEEDGKILWGGMAFIPEGRIEEKNRFEKIDYREFIRNMKCIACGDKIIDYAVVENFVFNLEKEYGFTIVGIGYDRWNALSSAQKWSEEYNTIEIKQHSSVLHPPTKLLYEKIMSQEFEYEDNKLLEINFQNAKCTFDTNNNRYVTKKKSTGKVDLVVATINSIYLLQQDVLFGDNFTCQII